MRTHTSLLGALALLGGCISEAPMNEAGHPDLPPLAEDRSQPRLALAEHLLAEYFASDIASQPTVCLAVSEGRSEEALPPEQETGLVARFPRLAPFSRCGWSPQGWRDIESEEPALVFTIHSFTCASATQCDGWASYISGANAAPSSLYRMRYENGRWQIARDRRLLAE